MWKVLLIKFDIKQQLIFLFIEILLKLLDERRDVNEYFVCINIMLE